MVIVDDHLALLVLTDVPVADHDVALVPPSRVGGDNTPSVVHGPGRPARALASVPDSEAAFSRILHPHGPRSELLHDEGKEVVPTLKDAVGSPSPTAATLSS